MCDPVTSYVNESKDFTFFTKDSSGLWSYERATNLSYLLLIYILTRLMRLEQNALDRGIGGCVEANTGKLVSTMGW